MSGTKRMNPFFRIQITRGQRNDDMGVNIRLAYTVPRLQIFNGAKY